MNKIKYMLTVVCIFGIATDIMAAQNCAAGQSFCLEAVDADNAGRKAATGGTLSMVVGTSARTADITASSPSGSFPVNQPVWINNSTGANGDTTVTYTSSTIEDKTITAVAYAESKNVNINMVGKQSNTIPFGTMKSDDNMAQNVASKLKFPGGASFSFSWEVGSFSYNSEMVDKYNNPDVDWKRDLTLDINASVSGRITHPQFSGSVGNWAIWELYAEASLAGSAAGGVEVDPSSQNSSLRAQNLSASLTGSVEAGYWVYCNVWFVKLDGTLSASTSVTGAGQLSGKDVQYNGSWSGLVGNVTLKCYGSDPNDPWVDYSGQKTLIAGSESGWKTAFTMP